MIHDPKKSDIFKRCNNDGIDIQDTGSSLLVHFYTVFVLIDHYEYCTYRLRTGTYVGTRTAST